MDGGYSLRTPVDAIAEFRILTAAAPAGYGGASGATTTVSRTSSARRSAGRLRRNRDFLFGYYEGFRNRQGITRSATAPSEAQRAGDFSGAVNPQTGQPATLVNYFTGEPFPESRIPPPMMNATALKLAEFYPHPNAGPNPFVTTQTMSTASDQGGLRYDHVFHEADQLFVHYTRAVGSSVFSRFLPPAHDGVDH